MHTLGQFATTLTKKGGTLIFVWIAQGEVTSSSATSGVVLVERKELVVLICGLLAPTGVPREIRCLAGMMKPSSSSILRLDFFVLSVFVVTVWRLVHWFVVPQV
ncbi:hypothetical protein CEXT_630721 [Caerostris extrusa]|uniref:Uncharacterized protein n=1 Tax=Caerostris extrusa TaxID=172846 RepID=A0AAV4TLN8_CAEEX|nr:hypothetical protein CEXT_630721 [Caerostris extrusa]